MLSEDHGHFADDRCNCGALYDDYFNEEEVVENFYEKVNLFGPQLKI